MPVYNESEFIRDSVASVLNQTFKNFELIIIDDASTDDTVFKIRQFNDSRINLIIKSANSGYTKSLNHGIEIARGKYIARMDGDDICIPFRFKKQIEFLEANSSYILCGSQFERIDEKKGHLLPTEDKDIKSNLFLGNQFIHPSIMIRKSVLIDYNLRYDENKEPAEDFDLWVRLMPYGRFKNVSEPLLKYRIHNNQVSNTQNQLQKYHDISTRLNYLKIIGVKMDKGSRQILDWLFSIDETNIPDIKTFRNFTEKIRNSDYKKFYQDRDLFWILMLLEKKLIKNKKRIDLSNSRIIGFYHKIIAYIQIKLSIGFELPIYFELQLFKLVIS